MQTIALIGRPNVGKSTLFNRMAGKTLAIVDDQPGVTRDWRDAEAMIFDTPVRILDTAGWDKGPKGSLADRMRANTETALAQADLALFVVDGSDGATPVDEALAKLLRKSGKPVLLVVNKCDRKAARAAINDFYRLGFDEPHGMSAVHGDGLGDLYQEILKRLPQEIKESAADDEGQDGEETADALPDIDDLEGNEGFEFTDTPLDETVPIKVAIVGRPNAGKSTFINAVVGEDRMLTGPEAGITRDAIATYWNWQNRRFRLVDTAGMRRKSKVEPGLERMATAESTRAIRLAHVVVLMIDATLGFDRQDQALADLVIREGRGLVVVFNKMDAIDDGSALKEEVQYRLDTGLGQLPDVPVVYIAAEYKRGIDKVMRAVLDTFDRWQGRVSTGKLNRWVGQAESRHPAPLVAGRPNRLRYMTQVKTRPPTFALWCSRPDDLPKDYQRYLINGLREDFDLDGIAVRLMLRTSKNPYV